jgi:hypothetical protein
MIQNPALGGTVEYFPLLHISQKHIEKYKKQRKLLFHYNAYHYTTYYSFPPLKQP